MIGRRPKVLLVAAANRTSGGGEKHVADLLRTIDPNAAEFAVACPPGGDLPDIARAAHADVYPAAIAGGPSLSGLADLRRAVAHFRPDIVHAHGSRAALYARLATPRPERSVIYTVHGIHADQAGSPLRRLAFLALERLLVRRTALFITVCASDAEKGARLSIVDPARTRVVYNGVPLPAGDAERGVFRREIGVADSAELAVCIGRFHEQKDHATLIDAFARLAGERPRASLVLVGSGPLEESLRARVEALGLRERVAFAAPRADLAPVYADADAVVLSSLWEGLPYVVLEAMSYARAVVATDVDGVPEAITDGETGVLVPPGDAEVLAAALARVLADPDTRRRLGDRGRAVVAERFTVSRMAHQVAGIYSEWVDPADSGSRGS